MKEKLVGGRGDNRPDSAFDPAQLAAGIKVEREHTEDPQVAREIAKDHLTEDEAYYRKLKRVEKAGAVKAPLLSTAAPPKIPKPPAARVMEKAMDPILKSVLAGQQTPSQALGGLPLADQTRLLRELRQLRKADADELEKKYMGTWTPGGIQPGAHGAAPVGMKPGEAKPLGKTPEESEAHAKKLGLPSATGEAHPKGEGSRGGHVTGHSASGKPVYGAQGGAAKPPPIPQAVAKGGAPAGSFKRIRDATMAGPGKKPDDPDAVAAKVYRQKYGAKTLERRSAAARKAEAVLAGEEILSKAMGGLEALEQLDLLRELRKAKADPRQLGLFGGGGEAGGGQKAPQGYQPVPGSSHGGFRKRQGAGYVYWYPGKGITTTEPHEADLAEHHRAMAALTPAAKPEVTSTRQAGSGSGAFQQMSVEKHRALEQAHRKAAEQLGAAHPLHMQHLAAAASHFKAARDVPLPGEGGHAEALNSSVAAQRKTALLIGQHSDNAPHGMPQIEARLRNARGEGAKPGRTGEGVESSAAQEVLREKMRAREAARKTKSGAALLRPPADARKIQHEFAHRVHAGYHQEAAADARDAGDVKGYNRHRAAAEAHIEAVGSRAYVRDTREGDSDKAYSLTEAAHGEHRNQKLAEEHEAKAAELENHPAMKGDWSSAKPYRDLASEHRRTARELLEASTPSEDSVRKEFSAEAMKRHAALVGDVRKSLQPGATKPVGKDPLMKDQKASIGDKPSPDEQKKAKGKGKQPVQQQDDMEQEPQPGSPDYHRDKALAHLAAAQAHANAHASAKKIAETGDHDEKVKQAEEASAGSISKGNMHIDLGAEADVLRFLEGGGQVGGDFSALPDPRGTQRMAALRGGVMTKSQDTPEGPGEVVGGTIFHGEMSGPRGGDNRETAMRLKEQLMTVEDDPAGNRGQGGLDEWFKDAHGNAEGIETDVNVPVGPMSMVRKAEEPGVQIIDDSDPYTRALYRADPRDGAAGLRMAYQAGSDQGNRRGQ